MKTINLSGFALKETDLALLVDFGDQELWVPKSLIDDDSEVFEEDTFGEICLPVWFAKKNGLI